MFDVKGTSILTPTPILHDAILGVRIPGELLQPIADIRMDATAHLSTSEGEARLLGCHCPACGERAFPVRAVCPSCGGRELESVALPADGLLYSFSVVHVSASRPTPYAIGYVDLSDGVRILAQLGGDAADYHPDMPVRLRVNSDDWNFEAVREADHA